MNQVQTIARKYSARIGKANERTTFMHSAEAAEAARELATVSESTYITDIEYNFVWRLGQVLGDARFFSAVSHEANGVFLFVPQRLS